MASWYFPSKISHTLEGRTSCQATSLKCCENAHGFEKHILNDENTRMKCVEITENIIGRAVNFEAFAAFLRFQAEQFTSSDVLVFLAPCSAALTC